MLMLHNGNYHKGIALFGILFQGFDYIHLVYVEATTSKK